MSPDYVNRLDCKSAPKSIVRTKCYNLVKVHEQSLTVMNLVHGAFQGKTHLVKSE